eukprot:GILI01038537.1.p1 GENE.GILI01038537.1~~GILI01038537.1.p1  ORF type:complete len:401 (+),score=80.85 GILI01038537.1:47-1249(+)
MTSRVLVLGAAEAPVESLVKAIVGSSAAFRDVNVGSFRASSWFLETKYYRANLEVVFGLVSELKEPSVYEFLSNDVEALVLVYDVLKKETFIDLEGASAFIEDFNPPVCLCFANRSSEEAATIEDASREEVVGWCIDKGCEYVHDNLEEYLTRNVSASSTSQNAEGSAPFDDKEGVDRLIEALQCNMWTHMEYLTSRRPISLDPQSDQFPSKPFEIDADKFEKEVESTQKSMFEGLSLKDSTSSDSSMTSSSSSSTPAPVPSTSASAPASLPNTDCLSCGKNNAGFRCGGCKIVWFCDRTCQTNAWKSHKAACRKEQDRLESLKPQTIALPEDPVPREKDSLEDFERLIAEMRQTKNMASSLSDEERRDRAANMAMKLWDMIKDDADGDGEEEDEPASQA